MRDSHELGLAKESCKSERKAWAVRSGKMSLPYASINDEMPGSSGSKGLSKRQKEWSLKRRNDLCVYFIVKLRAHGARMGK